VQAQVLEQPTHRHHRTLPYSRAAAQGEKVAAGAWAVDHRGRSWRDEVQDLECAASVMATAAAMAALAVAAVGVAAAIAAVPCLHEGSGLRQAASHSWEHPCSQAPALAAVAAAAAAAAA